MAKTANKDRERIMGRKGERLREVMGDMSPSVLLRTMKERYGVEDSTSEYGYYLKGFNELQTLSNILGKRGMLQNEHARMAAKILDIDVNYLLGTIDDFKEPSYEAYCTRYGDRQRQLVHNWNKYNYLLNMAGYKVVNTFYNNDTVIAYRVSHKGQSSIIAIEDMENFYNDVCKFIKKRFAPVMELGEMDKPPVQITTEHGTITDEDRSEGR